jgi:methionine synthase II (cobalamin-independent)
MSVKETIHQWIDELTDDSPELLDLYERVRLSRAIEEGMEDVRAGRVSTPEEVRQRHEQRCRLRRSA